MIEDWDHMIIDEAVDMTPEQWEKLTEALKHLPDEEKGRAIILQFKAGSASAIKAMFDEYKDTIDG